MQAESERGRWYGKSFGRKEFKPELSEFRGILKTKEIIRLEGGNEYLESRNQKGKELKH